MSRADNLVGQFYTEGSGAFPWTDEDERRLRGEHVQRFGGRVVRLVPHVSTPGGLFKLGCVALPVLAIASCLGCRAPKVRALPAAQGEGFWCFGCGRRWA